MRALMITVQFTDVPPSTQRLLAQISRSLNKVDGMQSTTWMRNGNTYGLFQLFDETSQADNYVDGDLLGNLATLPGAEDVYIQEFDTVDGLNAFIRPSTIDQAELQPERVLA